MRVYPSDEKAFVFSYRVNGRKRLMRIGRCSTMTLEQARKRVRKLDVAVSDGEDPLQDRERKRTAGTFRDLVDKYIEDQKARKKKTWAKTRQRLDPQHWGLTPDYGGRHTAMIGLMKAGAASRSGFERNLEDCPA